MNSSFSGGDEGLLGDENSIKELTLVLLSYSNALVSTGGAEGDGGVIVTLEDQLVLDIGVQLDSDTINHVNVLDLLTTEEVLNIKSLLVLGAESIDREMGVDQFHSVHEALYISAYN
jgi:hypothetical protein